MHLSEHFTLGEFTESSHKEVYNIPNPEALENLKRLCVWLEALRSRYNLRYVLGNGERSVSPPRSALPLCSAKNSGGEEITRS